MNSLCPAWFVALLTVSQFGPAQTVQWADELLRYSSQHSPKQFSADQVVGKYNKLPDVGSSPVAWAPKSEDGGHEYVHVKFKQAIRVRQIAVAENLNPGAISEIYLYDTRNKQHKVYDNPEMRVPLTPGGRMFRHFMPLTEYSVSELKLVLRTDAVPGSNQIDAIAISDSDERIDAIVNTYDDPNFTAEPEHLGSLVNSRYDDMLPIISPDGKELYFGRKFSPENVGEMHLDDIYTAKRNSDGTWGPASNIGRPLNNEYPNYVCAVSPDGNRLVLANEYNPTGGLTQGVSIATRTHSGWTRPKDLRIKSFYNLNKFSCYHINPDMDVLVMAIERHDTYGDMDLYVSFKETGWNWSEPRNLGPIVNSAATEGSVYLAADNRTIFFCSDGFPGYGSFDMFMSRRLDDTWTNWSEPLNLGPEINSRLRDFYYTIPASGEYAYFSSDHGAIGKSDMYRIKLPDAVKPLPVTMLTARAIDGITQESIDVPIQVRTIRAGEVIIRDDDGELATILPRKEATIISIDEPGYYPVERELNVQLTIPEEDLLDFDESDIEEEVLRDAKNELRDSLRKELDQVDDQDVLKVAAELEAEAAELDSISKADEEAQRRRQRLIDETIRVAKEERERKLEELRRDLEAEAEAEVKREEAERLKEEGSYQEIAEDIELVPLKEGQVVRLDNIWFDANKWSLRPESTKELDHVVAFLKDNPSIYAEIGGHTNGLPTHEFCDTLSDNRAQAVVEYLVHAGVSANRLTWKGYGKREPIATNNTLAGRKRNQRVELKIVKVE